MIRRLMLACFLCLSSLNLYALNPGALDVNFNAADIGNGNGDGYQPVGGNLSYNSVVTATQPDGKVLVGGGFTTYHGQTRNYLCRLNADGTLDTAFAPSFSATVTAIKLLPDGKMLVGGSFGSVNGLVRQGIARLNADGSLDTTFNAGTVGGGSRSVNFIKVLPDEKILIAGGFVGVGGVQIRNLARLQTNGALDTGFNTGTGPVGTVAGMLVQTDGKIVIGGDISSFNGVTKYGIVRVLPDGALDTGFTTSVIGTSGNIKSMALQNNGDIVIAGHLTYVNNQSVGDIVRIHTDGSIDAGFHLTSSSLPWMGNIVLQPDEKILVSGSLSGGTSSLMRLNTDGSVDSSLVGTTAFIGHAGLQPSGQIIVAGAFLEINGVVRGGLARLNSDGTVDTAFHAVTGANSAVMYSVVQPDGKAILAGNFTSVNDQSRSRIVRMNVDGTVDGGFNSGTGPNYDSIGGLALQTDGKVLVYGQFSSFNGVARNCIVRLNTNGSVDTTFNPGAALSSYQQIINSIYVQPDGRLVVNSQAGIKRFQLDGSLDNSLNSETHGVSSSQSRVLLPMPGGKWLVAGYFYQSGAYVRNGLIRLHPDGSLDMGFDAGLNDNLRNRADAAALQSDGKILIAGRFTAYNGKSYLARINPDGTFDSSFNTGTGPNGAVSQVMVQADGKILIGGDFTQVNGVLRERLARLNADGSVESSAFNFTGAGSPVQTLSLRPDGRVVVGGSFTIYNGIGRNRFMVLGTGDTDADGIEDGTDPDTDGDGILNSVDPFVWTPLDTDGDGTPDNVDLDDDNDHVPDSIDSEPLDPAIDTMPLHGAFHGSAISETQLSQ